MAIRLRYDSEVADTMGSFGNGEVVQYHEAEVARIGEMLKTSGQGRRIYEAEQHTRCAHI